ncbi:MAG TPA: glucose-1-phosphate adenylyltransferase [Bacilli bacterium]|jgi:glucose-1-phosphate adenylyltransferase|nr:glucose-1-phosphate adenylyltransferase [Bacilli bacterium]NLT01516.1 glucose-1-phosphate adenylyltransferase [Acholeplasmataceae bacterium]HNZ77577.1 glucose-1-phosphate adenylyltransferase [Bacilli bacterium]HOD60536.1 glucose-1-phosphate adenylyltransferase [Bacilli bacterium]HOE06113.1 glucose-1-phosphate adenylyltransferase [Bacilli bacterium]
MLNKKECVAMLLAGGQGSRLYALTNKIAKPAVSYGAKYRIIDFPLSNCINSNIDTVGVLTQYQPLLLNDYIGNGQPWDLDRTFGGVHILPPYQGKNKTDWYKGTANAIYQNIDFMKRYHPEYIIILSGDHIYKMDYSKMLDFHKEKNAEATIAVINVSLQEASRFGIMNTDQEMRIQEFEEKPAKPKSTKASMGIYIFNAEVLYQYLEADEANPESQNDFGKNIIPSMLRDGRLMYAYPFSGYWKDVGTIDSLWEANMDLLGENPKFDLFDKMWKIYSRNEAYPPQFICEGSKIENSLLTVGCYIEGYVKNSLLSQNVQIGKNAKVIDSVLFDNVIVEEGATIEYSIVAENVVVKKQAKIGESKQKANKITVIGSDVTILEDYKVAAGQMIEKDVRK